MKGFYYVPKLNDKVVVLTGSGISEDSGLTTVRDCNGLWTDVYLEEVSTTEAYLEDPSKVLNFYKKRFSESQNSEPNSAHISLALLEKKLKKNLLIVTLNIDNLHQKAGSKNVLCIHGELGKAICSECNFVINNFDYTSDFFYCPVCKTNKKIRPYIAWLDEEPFCLDKILAAVQRANLFITIGINNNVYPVKQLADIATKHGAITLSINMNEPDNNSLFEFNIHGRASKIVPDLVQYIIKNIRE